MSRLVPADPDPVDVAATSRDEHLRTARRVDWRFLLESPALGDVVVAGRPGAALRAALATHAASVHLLDDALPGPARAGRPALADLGVVVGAVPDATLATCAGLLRPGGSIVAELPGLTAWRPGRPLRDHAGVTRLIRRLAALGFGPISVHLAWPSHAATTAFIPLRDPAALSAWLARRVDERVSTVVARAGSLITRFGLPALLAPALTVVARRPEDDRPGDPDPGDWLARRLEESIPAVSGRTEPRSVVVLTPRFRASGHVVALADLPASAAHAPRAVLKVARLERDTDGIVREAEAIRRVSGTLGVARLAPTLLTLETDAALPFLVETGLAGHPLDPAAVRRDPAAAARGIAALVARMPAGDDSGRPLDHLVRPALRIVRERSPERHLDDLIDQTEREIESVSTVDLPIFFEHGDLAHPNLIRRADGAIAAVDWERAEPLGLPLHDLVIGLAYVAAATRGARSPSEQASAFREALDGPDPWLRGLIDAELSRLAIDPVVLKALLVAPWVRTTAWLAERTDHAWWRDDRSIALWRAMLWRH